MADYDLTHKLSGFLDHHMTLAVMQNAIDKGMYEPASILQSKLKLLESMGFHDRMPEVYAELGQEVPNQITEQIAAAETQVEALSTELEPILDFFSKEEVIAKLKDTATDKEELLEQLKQLGFEPSMLDTMYKGARVFYNLENYEAAGQILYNFRLITADETKNMSALWGRLAAEIMANKFEDAYNIFKFLAESIDASGKPLQQLQQRGWLMHWSLFIFFFGNGEQIKLSEVLDRFLYTPSYNNAIQMICPHMLRYVAAVAVLTSKTKRQDNRDPVKDVIRVIRYKTAVYSDPITDLLASIYINFDFDKAFASLHECLKVFEADFFLESYKDDFVDIARKLIFEVYCSIHSSISIDFVSKHLGASAIDAEKWIVQLIQSADLSARIEQAEGYVTMLHDTQSTYDQVLDMTRVIPVRTKALSDSIRNMGRKARTFRKREE
eukprot:m.192005 g.192005  ORF g.192005 m.192005 type:complete len:439 (+) comp16762_c10_seq8:104-1420(+)